MKKWSVLIRDVGSHDVEAKELAAKAEFYLEPEMVEVLKKFQLRHYGSIID